MTPDQGYALDFEHDPQDRENSPQQWIVCKHCGKTIVKTRLGWCHVPSYLFRCSKKQAGDDLKYAEPDEKEEA